MDRNEGIIRWSPNISRSDFMVINLKNQVVQLYEATGFAQPGNFDYNKVSKHADFPPVNTYDWSPAVPGLVAIGTSHGDVHLLRVDDNSNARFHLPQKLQRPIQSVAFNSTGLLAVGLDRIRNDSCLQIWDINQRLADWDSSKKGWDMPVKDAEPVKKFEGSTSITSIRFFEDNPNTLVTGIKNQSVRVHDLRDPNSSVITFQTKCCNNIAIDYNDQNYFASSTLDQPGFSIWDKRVASRSTASPMYLETFDEGEVNWGSVLKLDKILQTDKHISSSVKQLRYSREQRGCLGVLSSAGQLQVFQTKKEYIEPGSSDDIQGSPQLLEVKKTYDLEYAYFDEDRKKKYDQRIVSFDWVNVGSSALQGRVVALRGNGNFEIMQMPASTNNHIGQFMPWQTPHHAGDPYFTLPRFENIEEAFDALGPVYTSAIEAITPAFGPDSVTSVRVASTIDQTVKMFLKSGVDMVIDLHHLRQKEEDDKAAEDLARGVEQVDLSDKKGKGKTTLEDENPATHPSTKKSISSREMHDRSHYTTRSRKPISKDEHDMLDHTMLNRAIAGYLFDCQKNFGIVADDQWLQGVWKWIANAEQLSKDDGMVSLPLDISYLGVFTLWTNDLGAKSQSRFIKTAITADESDWEELIQVINRKANRPGFDGVETTKPQHRELCLATLGLLQSPVEMDEESTQLEKEGKITTAAARALFQGHPKIAVKILKAGGNDLLFVAMALDIKLKSGTTLDLDDAEWNQSLEKHPQMAVDPYLRAIYGYITSGDWTTVVEEDALPMRDRVGVALRTFEDDKLTAWLSKEMELAIEHGDIEGIVLAGITDNMADIFAKYIEKFGDHQTPMLVLSFCYPRYIDDIRCDAWRKAYQAFLQRHRKFILRVKFETQSMRKSRQRDGTSVIKPPPRQVTIRCLNCDANAANDLRNTGAASTSAAGPSSSNTDMRNPLAATGIHAGLCCPTCGAHLPRCAVCMEIVGVPRSDRPELSVDAKVRKMANFPTFCLKCRHVMHMDHSLAWFARHVECPVAECRCQCNAEARQRNTK